MILCLRTSRKGKNKNKKGYSLQLEVHVLPRVLKRVGVISAVYPKDGWCNVGQVYLSLQSEQSCRIVSPLVFLLYSGFRKRSNEKVVEFADIVLKCLFIVEVVRSVPRPSATTLAHEAGQMACFMVLLCCITHLVLVPPGFEEPILIPDKVHGCPC